MFTLKTQNELAEMTEEQVNKYQADYDAHKTATMKQEVSNEVKKATNDLKDFLGEEIKGQIAEISTKGGIQELGVLAKFHKERVEKDAYANGEKGKTTIKAPELMTTANVIPNVAGGFNQLFGNYVDQNIYTAPKQDPFILPLVDVQFVDGTESIWYVEAQLNPEGNAMFIGEGDLKPLIDAEARESKAEIKEVAERWKFSKRLMNNAPAFVSNFQEHANDLFALKIDDGVLAGSGTGDELTGITTVGTPFVAPTQLANYFTNANIYDGIISLATAVRLANHKGALVCVLNTVWKAKMQGIKNNDGDYIVPPFVTQDGMNVGEVRLVFSNRIGDDKILLGDLKKFKVVISQNAEYAEGWENDDFSKNLVSRRIDAYLGTYFPNTQVNAIIFDDISTVLEQIEVVTP